MQLRRTLGRGRSLVLSRPSVLRARHLLLTWRKRRQLTVREGNVSMLHLGRCGSSVVASLLDQHPWIHWDGEVFDRLRREKLPEKWMVDHPLDMLRIRMEWSTGRYYGFETKFGPDQHLSPRIVGLPLAAYIDRLRELGFSDFILLERRNYLRQLASALIAWKRDRQHMPSERHPRPTSFHLPVEAVSLGGSPLPLVELFEHLDTWYLEARRLIGDAGGLRLVYEDDVERDPLRAYRKICDHLGIDPHTPQIRLGRTNPFPLSQVMENYGAVEQVLKGTPYAWMVEG